MAGEVLKKEYVSKSLTLLVPLTGLAKTQKYPMSSYLFWDNYSIENYQLILKFDYNNYDEFIEYCMKTIFPCLDKEGYLLESYDYEGFTIFVLDMSIWKYDIDLFIEGKYSKLSKEARKFIINHHKYYDKGPKLDIYIHAMLEPFYKFPSLNNVSAIDYVADTYGLDVEELRKVGELGSKYDKKAESLEINTDELAKKQ